MKYATIDETSLTVDIKDFSKYLTVGKKYEVAKLVTEPNLNHPGFRIKLDNGSNVYCLVNGCAHLSGGNWIITEE